RDAAGRWRSGQVFREGGSHRRRSGVPEFQSTHGRLTTSVRLRLAPLLFLVLAFLALPAHSFDLQGHRGARGLAPENTLPAFERALALGVTTLELDTSITSDGVVVIHHDSTLNPDTTRDSAGRFLERRGPPIHSLSWAELQTYDVGRLRPGSDYAKRY